MHIPDTVRRMPAQHPCLEPALEATVRAAGELMERFGKSMDVESKGTANFVSEADKAAEYAILKTLRRSYPDHGYLAEESQTSIVSTSEHLWIIDPLDGTSNYLHGIPHFAISIAYYRNREPELAIVHDPVTQDWYVAARGQGAWTTQGRQQVCDATRLNEVLVACGFYYDRGAMMRATLDTIATFFECDIHGMRRFGAAALDLCNLGSGHYGVFFEYQLHPWDFAAGQLFVQEAGGVCTDCDGKALPLDGPSSICATNKSLHQVALAKIAPHWRGLQR